MSELQLRQDILDELEFEPSVNAAHIGVAVKNGVVTLTSHVGLHRKACGGGCSAPDQGRARHR